MRHLSLRRRHVSAFLMPLLMAASTLAAEPDPYPSSRTVLEAQLSACPGIDAAASLRLLSSRLSSSDREIRWGMEAILQEAAWLSEKAGAENPALSLRAALALAADAPGPGCIDEALALANAWLWSVADPSLRKTILADCVAHRELFASIVRQQRAEGVPLGLDGLPLVPAILWADRVGPSFWELHASISASPAGRLDAHHYREFVDSPESLLHIRKTVLDKGLWRGSARERAGAAEDFVHASRDYRSSMENLVDFNARRIFSDQDLATARAEAAAGLYEIDYLGKKRRWDGFNWLNWQVGLFRRTGRFRGDCGSTTTIQMAFFRMSGLAPLSIQWIDAGGLAAFTHNCPAYYHPGLRRWLAVQRPVLTAPGGAAVETAVPSFLHYTKPALHPWRLSPDWKRIDIPGAPGAIQASLYPGEFADHLRIGAALEMDIPAAALEASIFRMPDGLASGSLIPAAASTGRVRDSDWDGLSDAVEMELGTDPQNADSDADGRTDAWELDQGADPLRAEAWPRGIPILDGFAMAGEYDAGARAPDPAADLKTADPSKDIRAFSCAISGATLHCAVGFSGPAALGKPETHSILVQTGAPDHRRYWFQWVGPYSQAYLLEGADESTPLPLPSTGLRARIGREAEFAIPLAIMPPSDRYFVRYHASGRVEGVDVVTDDYSAFLRPPFAGDDFITRTKAALDRAISSEDPTGDASGGGRARDIVSVKALRVKGGDCLIRARFVGPICEAGFGLITIHAREESTGRNWWLQWWSLAEMVAYAWKDGQDSRPMAMGRSDAQCAEEGNELLFWIRGALLEGSGRLTLSLHSGYEPSPGSWKWDADLGPALDLPAP